MFSWAIMIVKINEKVLLSTQIHTHIMIIKEVILKKCEIVFAKDREWSIR